MKILLFLALACVAVSANQGNSATQPDDAMPGGQRPTKPPAPTTVAVNPDRTFCKACQAARKAGTQSGAEKKACKAKCNKEDTTTPEVVDTTPKVVEVRDKAARAACKACKNAVKAGTKAKGDCDGVCAAKDKPEATPSPVADPVEEPKKDKPKKVRNCSKNGDKPKSLPRPVKPKKKCKGDCLKVAKVQCTQSDKKLKRACMKEVGLEAYTPLKAVYDGKIKPYKRSLTAIKKWVKKCGKGCVAAEQDDGSTQCVNDPNFVKVVKTDTRTKEEKKADRIAAKAEKAAGVGDGTR